MVWSKSWEKKHVCTFFRDGFQFGLAQLFFTKIGIDKYHHIAHLNMPALCGTFLKKHWLLTNNAQTKSQKINQLKLFLFFSSKIVGSFSGFVFGLALGQHGLNHPNKNFAHFLMSHVHTYRGMQTSCLTSKKVYGFVVKTCPNKALSNPPILLQETLYISILFFLSIYLLLSIFLFIVLIFD